MAKNVKNKNLLVDIDINRVTVFWFVYGQRLCYEVSQSLVLILEPSDRLSEPFHSIVLGLGCLVHDCCHVVDLICTLLELL